jgi:CHASE3 domain sensor protein
VKNANMLAERVAQLRPIKRRITLLFSVAVVVMFVAAVLLWVGLSVITSGAVAS